jgi:hypothetical protein
LLLLAVTQTIAPPPCAAQAAAGADTQSTGAPPAAIPTQPSSAPHIEPGTTYRRPTESTKLQNYLFDAFGPYPIAAAAIAGGIEQAYGTPREWGGGVQGYGKRVGSVFGIALTATTSRYTLAEILREDTLYYRCECKGAFPRLKHAVVSTFTARRGDDGHRVFSIPSLASPYVGTMTAALGWYPGRYKPMDGFRMGNYNLLGYMAGNIAIEFLYGGPHEMLTKMHLTSRRAAPESNP